MEERERSEARLSLRARRYDMYVSRFSLRVRRYEYVCVKLEERSGARLTPRLALHKCMCVGGGAV